MRGWYRENYRHSLAARGIKTARFNYVDNIRYGPEHKDKIVLVDLDSTVADIEEAHMLRTGYGFDFIEEVGIPKFLELMKDVSSQEDGLAMVTAYSLWKAGKLPKMTLNPGTDMQVDYYIFERPGMKDKLRELAKNYRLVLYTAAGPIYAKRALETMGLSDLFENIYSRPFIDGIHEKYGALEGIEGLKPLSPMARRLGVRPDDLLILDDDMNVVGPLTSHRLVQSPGEAFPTEIRMKDFFQRIDAKLAEKESKQIPLAEFSDLPQVRNVERSVLPIATSMWEEEEYPPLYLDKRELEKSDTGLVKEKLPEEKLVRSIHAKPLPFFKDIKIDSDEEDYSYASKKNIAYDRTSKLLETGSSIGFNIRKFFYYDLPKKSYEASKGDFK